MKRKRLVIDTSVAKAATENEHRVSSSCRRFLTAVREICHSLVLSDKIQAEHKDKVVTRWYTRWRASMAARKKLASVRPLPEPFEFKGRLTERT